MKLALTSTDKVVEALGWMTVLLIWVLTTTQYTRLPDIIPIHYNATGNADGFGNKSNLLVLTLVATVLFIGLSIVNRFPHVFNYPTTITPENAQRQYAMATRLLRYLKLIIAVIFGMIIFMTIRNTDSHSTGLGAWFLPIILGFIFTPLIVYLFQASKAR